MSSDQFITHFQNEVFPMMESSVAILIILSDSLDSKICLEVGAAILLNKPIIVVAKAHSLVPQALEKVAYKLIVGDVLTDEVKAQVHQALDDLVENYS